MKVDSFVSSSKQNSLLPASSKYFSIANLGVVYTLSLECSLMDSLRRIFAITSRVLNSAFRQVTQIIQENST